MKITLASIEPGQAFTYGGMPWVKLEDASGGTLALAAESVFDRAFCTDTDRAIEQYNNWEYSTLRRELNDDFYESLLENGADAGAFLDMTVDLTADDGLDDYGTTTDKIALISCEQHRKYRRLIPDLEYWWWTLTPRTCIASNSYNVRVVYTSGALSHSLAYRGNWGVRPLCNLSSEILVSVDSEESAAETTLEARVTALEGLVAELIAAR